MTQTPPGLPPHTSSPTAPTVPIQVPTKQGNAHLLMIVPHEEGERQAAAMENWFQACSSDEAFALELAGTRREQVFLRRAVDVALQTIRCPIPPGGTATDCAQRGPAVVAPRRTRCGRRVCPGPACLDATQDVQREGPR